MIAIIDYGLGNIRSMEAAVDRVGFQSVVSADPTVLEKADKLILPGVGAFGDGVGSLHRLGLIPVLNKLVIEKKKPILGVCLGFQLLTKRSLEFGEHQGLGWLEAEVLPLERKTESLRIPHVGWNSLKQVRPSPLFAEISEDALFYYTHSYRVASTGDSTSVVGTCDYGSDFVAAMQKGNIFGTQFHPEKSQKMGLSLLHNFLKAESKC